MKNIFRRTPPAREQEQQQPTEFLDARQPAHLLELQFDAFIAARATSEVFLPAVRRVLVNRVDELCTPMERSVVQTAVRFYAGTGCNIFRQLREASGTENRGPELSRMIVDDFLDQLPIMQRLEMERELMGEPTSKENIDFSGPAGSIGLNLYASPQVQPEAALAVVIPLDRRHA